MNKQIVNGLYVLITTMYLSFMLILIVGTDRISVMKKIVGDPSHAEAVVLTIISLWVFTVLVLCKYHCDRAIQASRGGNALTKSN